MRPSEVIPGLAAEPPGPAPVPGPPVPSSPRALALSVAQRWAEDWFAYSSVPPEGCDPFFLVPFSILRISGCDGNLCHVYPLIPPVVTPLREHLAGSWMRTGAWPVAQAPGAPSRLWPRWPGYRKGRRAVG